MISGSIDATVSALIRLDKCGSDLIIPVVNAVIGKDILGRVVLSRSFSLTSVDALDCLGFFLSYLP